MMESRAYARLLVRTDSSRARLDSTQVMAGSGYHRNPSLFRFSSGAFHPDQALPDCAGYTEP